MRRDAVAGILALILGVTVAAFPAHAEQLKSRVPHLAEGQVVEANTYPWSAIAKLNNGAGGSCTAVMVSPRYALTAAHCLYFRRTGQFLPPQSFHLILGYQKQEYRDHILVSAYYVPPTYDPKDPYKTLESDWALLSIARNARSGSKPLKVSVDSSSDINKTLMTAGYSHRTPNAIKADPDCNFVGRSQDRAFLFGTCKAPSGFSGAPLLVKDAKTNSVSIAGIHVANQVYKTNEIAIAISIEAIWREIKPCVQSNQCEFQHVASVRDPSAAEVLAGMRAGHSAESSPLCQAGDLSCKTALTGP